MRFIYLRLFFNFVKYVSLLRPPITESSAPGADIIDKVEWKQVKYIIGIQLRIM